MTYNEEEIARYLLSNAIGEEEYEQRRKEVIAMGLDPDKIIAEIAIA